MCISPLTSADIVVVQIPKERSNIVTVIPSDERTRLKERPICDRILNSVLNLRDRAIPRPQFPHRAYSSPFPPPSTAPHPLAPAGVSNKPRDSDS